MNRVSECLLRPAALEALEAVILANKTVYDCHLLIEAAGRHTSETETKKEAGH